MICRFCQESENTDENRLIAPCNCIGSVKYVHINCLYRWIESSNTNRCNLCGSEYAHTIEYTGVIPESFITLLIDKDNKITSVFKWTSWSVMTIILAYAVAWRIYEALILSKLTWEKIALYELTVLGLYTAIGFLVGFFQNVEFQFGGVLYRFSEINFKTPIINIFAVIDFLLASYHVGYTGWILPVIFMYYHIYIYI